MVEKTIVVDGVDAPEVVRRLMLALGQDGVYRSLTVTTGTYQFLRTFRPQWAVVTGWVTSVLLLGGGLLFFLVKRTESCTVVVTANRRLSTVVLSGRLLPAYLAGLESALALGTVSGARQALVAADEPISSSLPSPASATAACAPLDAFDAAEDRTVVVPGRRAAQPLAGRGWVLAFDTGLRAALQHSALVGRDPAPMTADDGAAELVAVADPSMSVSKTHLAVGVDRGALWVEDRGSTNGTAVVDLAGSAIDLRPGTRCPLTPGAVVVFGERRFEVLQL